jgi:hypothetical protein
MFRQRPPVLLACPGKYISGALLKGIWNTPSFFYGCLHNWHVLWSRKQHRPNGLFHMSVKSPIHCGWFLIPSYFPRKFLHCVGYAFTIWHIVSALNCSKCYCILHNSSMNLAVVCVYSFLVELLTFKVRTQNSIVTIATRVWAGWSRVRILVGARYFSLFQNLQTSFGTLPTLLLDEYGGCFWGESSWSTQLTIHLCLILMLTHCGPVTRIVVICVFAS